MFKVTVMITIMTYAKWLMIIIMTCKVTVMIILKLYRMSSLINNPQEKINKNKEVNKWITKKKSINECVNKLVSK